MALESVVGLPLVGPELYKLVGWLSRPRVTFYLTQPIPVWVTSLNELTGAAEPKTTSAGFTVPCGSLPRWKPGSRIGCGLSEQACYDYGTIPHARTVCVAKMRLIDAYTAKTSALFEAITSLSLKTGAEFAKALAVSKAIRADCVKARRVLDNHKARHGC